MNVEKDEAV